MSAARPRQPHYFLPPENEFQIMLARLKVLLILSCLWTALSCAADNYGVNPLRARWWMNWWRKRDLTASNC
jgi:hypothetical protein